jgi:hypothetical protein
VRNIQKQNGFVASAEFESSGEDFAIESFGMKLRKFGRHPAFG